MDETSLLKAVLANPNDDTVRLVYADWLSENGNESRAEFIRFQVAGARIGEPGAYWRVGEGGAPARYRDLLAFVPWKSSAAMRAFQTRASGGYFQVNSSLAAVLWRRGFIEAVMCSGSSIGDHLKELMAHPIREARVTSSLPDKVCRKLWAAPPVTLSLEPASVRDARLLDALEAAFPKIWLATFSQSRLHGGACPFLIVRDPP